jgi:ribosomal protein S18 acetylase RimI-like enzyme
MTLTPDPNLPPRIQFRAPRPYDRRELAALYERRTGFGLETTFDLLFDDEQAVYGLLAVDVERIVGMGIVEIFHREGVEEYLAVDTEGYPIGDVNGVMHALAVHEEWEGRGIGTELLRLRLELVREGHDADAAFGVAWLRPHTADSSVLFETVGFDRLDTVDEYYRDLESDRDCPDCGQPCTCAAAIYGMELD